MKNLEIYEKCTNNYNSKGRSKGNQGYANLVKGRKEQIFKDLKKTYFHLSKGHKVLDIFEVFRRSGLNKKGEPKLAISLADKKRVYFHKERGGAGSFSRREARWSRTKVDVRLPSNTFSHWEREAGNQRAIERSVIEAKVPIIPAHLVPSGKLDNYYILFEVSDWKPMPVYKDPFLLKRINSNAFIVLAEWDLTPVEQAIIRGF